MHRSLLVAQVIEHEAKIAALDGQRAISLDRTQMQVEDKQVSLSPGMPVTAEIETGSWRIITYPLSRLLPAPV